ncbi:co-chaperone GroES [Hippea maritima]|uniref:Co-chaperonin GroES n=1 Tax=Hippea maritima (strain ATCC 700847 / DSM 10411 / MH2) TaxID=760142 RepID=F2LXB2_HIPMA|nr:co-chaperone GroES [Hippea maritima]AEA34226.1 10 kDa chaperonin [Hippea maritima DSM 10411]
MATLKPLMDRILVEPEDLEQKTESGIIIPDTAKEKPQQGKVVEVGEDVETVKKGDVIVFEKYAGNEIKLDDKKYVILKEDEVLAKFVD